METEINTVWLKKTKHVKFKKHIINMTTRVLQTHCTVKDDASSRDEKDIDGQAFKVKLTLLISLCSGFRHLLREDNPKKIKDINKQQKKTTVK